VKLTREERRRLLDAYRGEAEWPKLTRPGDKPCPIHEGERYQLSSLCWLEVLAPRRSAKGEHVIPYQVHMTEQLRYLLPSNHRVNLDEHGNPMPMTKDEELGYTGDSQRSLERGVPAVSRSDQERIDKQAEKRAEARREQERLRREQQTLETRLGIARKVAAIKNIDISTHERAIERRLLELERMLDERPHQRAA
jgi:hypothetical protein